jgi:arylsulfate sulfotransferase
MNINKMISSVTLAAMIATGISVTFTSNLNAAVLSKKKITHQGHLGKVIPNPYKIAPLTAIIDRIGKNPTDIKVTILAKKGGVDISYKVSRAALLNADGIPVFGLYADYINKVKVEMTLDGEKVVDNYKILTNPVAARLYDGRYDRLPVVNVKKVNPEFKDRLYLTSFMSRSAYKDWVWSTNNKDISGSGDWQSPSEIWMFDTQGEIRWYLDTTAFFDDYGRSIDDLGQMMSMHFYKNGDVLVGQAQKYYRFSMMGEMAFERKLPRGYIDMSHEVTPMPNGHLLIRVAKLNYNIPGTNDVQNTVRDIIIEVDDGGRVVHEWDMSKIMGRDTWRKDLIVALDAKAVCLNVDMHAKKIKIDEEKKAPYGDHPGTGTGRNWAHINSISYDESDDSVILSFRHQGVMKVGRDNKVKWILAPNVGWTKKHAAKVLTPVDAKGKKLDCEGATCKNTNFDWPFTQHTAWISPRGVNNKRYTTISVFDNGDGRGLDQPAFKTDKYSRAVEFVIDEKNHTVRQSWEFGKERGFSFFSVITSNVEWAEDTKTYSVFSAVTNLLTKNRTTGLQLEIDPKDNDVKLEMDFSIDKKPAIWYRTKVVYPNKLFNN